VPAVPLCLDRAARRDWPSFSCIECGSYSPQEMDPADLRVEADRCRALITLVVKDGARACHWDGLLDLIRAECNESVKVFARLPPG